MTVLGVGLDERTAWTRSVATRRLGQRILIGILAASWLVWAVLMFWGSARASDPAAARADATAGRVTAYEVSSGFGSPNIWVSANLPVADPNGMDLVWTTSDGRMHVTSLQSSLSPGQVLANSTGTGMRPGADRPLVQQLRASGAAPGVDYTWPLRTASIAGWFGVLLAAVVLVNGRAPVYGSRWYWFWVGLLPLGLGLLAWLAVERLPYARGSEPPTRTSHRAGGWTGLAWFILGLIVMQAALYVLRDHGPAWLFPA